MNQALHGERLQTARVGILRERGQSGGQRPGRLSRAGDNRDVRLRQEHQARKRGALRRLRDLLAQLGRAFHIPVIVETIGLKSQRLRGEIRVLQVFASFKASSRGAWASRIRPLRFKLFP